MVVSTLMMLTVNTFVLLKEQRQETARFYLVTSCMI
jgi:hypothetical protein